MYPLNNIMESFLRILNYVSLFNGTKHLYGPMETKITPVLSLGLNKLIANILILLHKWYNKYDKCLDGYKKNNWKAPCYMIS